MAMKTSAQLLTLLLYVFTSSYLFAGTPICEPKQDGLFVHSLSREFLPREVLSRANILSNGVTPGGVENPNVSWTRDLFPLQTTDEQGRLVVIPYLSALSPDGAPFDGSHYIPVPLPADAPPNAKSFKFNDKYHWLEVRSLPLLFEGGNVVATEKFVFIGQKVVEQNGRSTRELRDHYLAQGASVTAVNRLVSGLAKRGYTKRNKEQVIDEFAKAFGLGSNQIIVLPWMPGERTGHVDMFLATLDEQTIALPYVPQWLIDRLDYDHERAYAQGVNEWLAVQTKTIKDRTDGTLTVVRVPMLPPKNLQSCSLSSLGWSANLLATVNWILHEDMAFVPIFKTHTLQNEPGAAERFKDEIRSVLSHYGFQTQFVDCSRLLRHNGLLHCLTGRLKTPAN